MGLSCLYSTTVQYNDNTTLCSSCLDKTVQLLHCTIANVSGNINNKVCTAIERLAAIAILTTGGGPGSNINT